MFVLIGLVGVLVILLTFVFDDVLEGVLPGSDVFSGPALGAFLGALGITGWLLQTGFDASLGVAALGGLGAGLGLGWATGRAARALLHAPTDATPRTEDLVGRQARVITPITRTGVGEVLVNLGGQQVKLTAALVPAIATRTGTPALDPTVDTAPAAPDQVPAGAPDVVPAGTTVVIVAVESSTKVVVQASDEFWS